MFINKIKQILFLIKRFYHDLYIIKFSNEIKVFDKIYRSNYWGSDESKSGPGSNLNNTINIRRELPKIIKKYKIKKVLDIPCGDFYWMKLIMYKFNIKYIGCDIVPELIQKNKKLYSKKNIFFKRLDLIYNKLPKADLLICRALFYHLNYNNIKKIMKNISTSNIKYILITNNVTKKNHKNKNIIEGGYRELNLFKEPLNFPKNYLYRFDDNFYLKTKIVNEELVLWEKKDLIKNLKFLN